MPRKDETNIWDQEAIEEVLNNSLADYIEYDAEINNIEWYNNKTLKVVDTSELKWKEEYGITFLDNGVIAGWFLKKELLEVCDKHSLTPFEAMLAYIEGYYMEMWQRDNQCNAIYGECESVYVYNLNWSTVH